MKKICLTIVLFLIAIFISKVNAQPFIYFYEKEYNFGKVNQGDVIKHIFKFKNIGTETLIINKITSS